MNRFIITILASLCILSIAAQQEPDKKEYKTIITEDKTGGYGAFGMAYTIIDGRNSLLFTARAGFVINHFFSIGFAGGGFANEYQQVEVGSNYESSLVGGYGGLYAEIIPTPKWPVQVTFPVTAGMGGVSYATWDRSKIDEYEQEGYLEETSSYLFVEPGIEIDFKIARWMVIGIYGSYRFTDDIAQPIVEKGVAPNALDGYSAGCIFKFGKF